MRLEQRRAARGDLKSQARRSALAGFEARVGLADHKDLAATSNDFAITVAGLGGFERGKNFHGAPSGNLNRRHDADRYIVNWMGNRIISSRANASDSSL